jgi:predicted ATPase/class 3 adenylate cyclase
MAAPKRAAALQDEPAESHLQRYIPRELLKKLERAREQGEMVGERRIVTMMFCDVKGSTAAAGQLDPEEWAEIINGTFEHLITSVYRYEGTVARLMGDGILAFFGAPIAHEDDPQRAILAGLETLKRIQTYRRQVKQEWGLDINVRVGINTGLVVVGSVGSDLRMEYSALGDAINLAARMEQNAQSGTVQIAEATYKLVAPLFDFEDLGEIEVRGKDEPVQSYRVLGPKADPGKLRGIEGLESTLVGRDAELHTLRGAIIELRQGRGGIVSIIGEAGLGKSRLAAELRESPTPTGGGGGKLHWLEGRSLSYETTTPYSPFIRIFEDEFGLKAEYDDDQRYGRISDWVAKALPERVDDIAPFIASMLDISLSGDALERVRYLEPPQLRSRIFQATGEYFEAIASEQPLVLVFDDLHWVDTTTLELLEQLLPLTERCMLMLMTLFRPRRQEPSWAFHETAQREYSHRYTVVQVNPLDEASSRELVANLLVVEDLSVQVRSLIMAKAEGNPFFVEEVIRSMLDASLIVRSNGHWKATQEIADITIPDTLTAVLTTRLDQLDEASKQVLQMASVIGRRFNYETLSDLSGTNGELDGLLTELLKRELIREKSRLPQRIYMFKHTLTQEAAYNSLLLKSRRELHRIVGESMERREPERVNEIGRHFREAGDRERALPYIVEAGEKAARAYSTKIAIDYYGEAIQILESVDNIKLAKRAYEGLGSMLSFANDISGAQENYEHMLEIARNKGDAPMQVSALNKLAFLALLHFGQFEQADKYLVEADDLARAHEDKVGISESDLVRCIMCTAVADFDGVVRYMDEVIDIGKTLGVEEQMATGLAHIASSQVFMGHFDEAWETMEEGLALSRTIGDREHEAEFLAYIIPIYHFCRGDLEAARESTLEGIEIATRIGANLLMSVAWRSLGLAAYQQGMYEEAIDHMRSYQETAQQIGRIWWEVEAVCLLGSVYLDISPEYIERILDLHEQAEGLMEQPGGVIMGASAWVEIGSCALEVGDLEKAADMFQKGLTTPTITINLEQSRLMHGQALLALEQGEPGKAAGLLHEAGIIAHQQGMKITYPQIEISKGRISFSQGDLEDAAVRFDRAEVLALEMGLRPMVWKARVGQADVLSAQGEEARAEEKRAEAKAAADEMALFFKDPEMHRFFLQNVGEQLAS